MFGLIGLTSFEAARRKAMELGSITSRRGISTFGAVPTSTRGACSGHESVGTTIEGAYIDSCFVPEMLSRFKTARRKVLNAMELAEERHRHHAPRWFHLHISGYQPAPEPDRSQHNPGRRRFTTGNTHTAWVICRQVENDAPSPGSI